MLFKINTSNGVPVYEQVIRQVTFAIADGAFHEGEMIPSVRQIARDLAINPNTVARAFRELQTKGIVSSVRGQGLIIESGAKTKCKETRKKIILQRLKDVIDEARQSQLDDEEIRDLVEQVLSSKRRG